MIRCDMAKMFLFRATLVSIKWKCLQEHQTYVHEKLSGRTLVSFFGFGVVWFGRVFFDVGAAERYFSCFFFFFPKLALGEHFVFFWSR